MKSMNRVKKSVSYGNLDVTNNTANINQNDNSSTNNTISPQKHSNRNRHTNSSNSTITFESHAYEGLITTVRAYEARQYGEITAPLEDLLQYYDKGYMLSIGVQERMRNLKNDLTVIINRVQSSRNALHELTEDDEDMALMNLTFLKEKPSLYAYPLVGEILSKHDEMEELLESHILDFNSLVANIEYARTKIENAEDLVSLRLDTARNELLIANTALAVLACSIGFSAYITGVFGMNLDNVEGIQDVKGIFSSVFVTTLILIPALFIAICIYLKCSKVLPNGLSLQSDSKLL